MLKEARGWVYLFYTEYDTENPSHAVELETSSPAGEDFCMLIEYDPRDPVNSFLRNLKEYYDTFDPDAHAEAYINRRGEDGIPHSIRELLDDAEAIKKMILELWEQLSSTVHPVLYFYFLSFNYEKNDWEMWMEPCEVIATAKTYRPVHEFPDKYKRKVVEKEMIGRLNNICFPWMFILNHRSDEDAYVAISNAILERIGVLEHKIEEYKEAVCAIHDWSARDNG